MAFGQEIPEVHRAIAEQMKGHHKQAIELLDQALRLEPSNPWYLLLRGRNHYRTGHFDPAIRNFLSVEELRDGKASLDLARCYARTGDHQKAFSFLEKHLDSKYREPEAVVRLDPAFSKLESEKRWINIWKKNWYTDMEKLLAEIRYQNKTGHHIEALGLVNGALEKESLKHQLYGEKGHIFLTMKNYKNAVRELDKAIGINSRQTAYLIDHARSLTALGRYEEAVEDYDRVLSFEPTRFEWYTERAAVLSELGRYPEAVRDMEYYTELFPDDQEALFHLGTIHHDHEKYFKALECFNKILKKDRGEPEYFIARAKTYMETNTLHFAIKDFSMALDINPRDHETWFNKGLARFRSGDREGACFDWKMARQYGSAKAERYITDHCHYSGSE